MLNPMTIPGVAEKLDDCIELPTGDINPGYALSTSNVQVMLVVGQRFALTRSALPIDDDVPALSRDFLEAANTASIDCYQSAPFNVIANSRYVYRQLVLLIGFDLRRFLTDDGLIAGPLYELLTLSADSEPLLNLTGRRFLKRNTTEQDPRNLQQWQSMLLEQRLFECHQTRSSPQEEN